MPDHEEHRRAINLAEEAAERARREREEFRRSRRRIMAEIRRVERYFENLSEKSTT